MTPFKHDKITNIPHKYSLPKHACSFALDDTDTDGTKLLTIRTRARRILISVYTWSIHHHTVRPCLHETGTKSNRGDFGHNSFYSRYLHETETKIAQTGLKSSRLLDRADYVQTGMKSERDECKLKINFIPV